jgi:uncharacterized protein YjiS (DUF1127 family)
MSEICRKRTTAHRRFVAGLSDALDLLLLWRARQRERRMLGAFSDYMLKDIGVSRADVDFEVHKTFWRR